MYTVQQVVDLAKNGELKQLSLNADTDTVLGYINLGLLELYKRFTVRTEEHIIELIDGQSVYDMPDNFMWIVSAYGEVVDGTSVDYQVLPINKEDDENSINTISANQVQVPLSSTGSFISIIYIAAPEIFTDADLAEKISIPPQMLEALLHYIAFRGHSSVNSDAQTETNVYYARFEESCNKLKYQGMVNSDDMYMDNRVKDRGFV